MARGGYREQGSDQAVRVVFRPSLGPWDVMLIILGTMFLILVAVFCSVLFTWVFVDLILASLALTVVAPPLMVGLLRQAHELEIGPETVRLRSRHFPLIWSERQLPRASIAGVDRGADWEGRVQLTLRLHRGTPVPLLTGYRLDTDTATRMTETLDQALDPDLIEALADEHRPAAIRLG